MAWDSERTFTYGALARELDGTGAITMLAEIDSVLDMRVAAAGYSEELVTMSRSTPQVTLVMRPLHPEAADSR